MVRVLGVACWAVLVSACAGGRGLLAMDDEWCEQHDYPPRHCVVPADVSWDQERLKRQDSGCPTAVFVAPNGDLEMCP
jgi:hypothetical protein